MVGHDGIDAIGENVHLAQSERDRVDKGFVLSDGSFIVYRERIVARVLEHCKTAGILFVCAPDGFGKSALLMQCAATIESDPQRGSAALLSAASCDCSEMIRRIEQRAADMPAGRGSVILIDDVPALGEADRKLLTERLRGVRDRGYSVILACTPRCRPLVDAFGDSYKLGAHALKVQPREFYRWAKALSIATSLDVYELTQGVPSLVTALQAVAGERSHGLAHLDRCIGEFYRSVLDEAGIISDAFRRLLFLLIILDHGNVADLERGGVRVKASVMSRIKRDYPVFGFNTSADDRAFRCLKGSGAALNALRKEVASAEPSILQKAVRIHMRAGRVDDAVELMESLMKSEERIAVIAQFPTLFALHGHALFVRRSLAGLGADKLGTIEVGVLLALYLGALTMGDYGVARTVARELSARASEVERDISPRDWLCAEAVHGVWRSCSGIELPEVFEKGAVKVPDQKARELGLHARIYDEMLAGRGGFMQGRKDLDELLVERGGQLDIAHILLRIDIGLDEALHQGVLNVMKDDACLKALADELMERRLTGIAVRVRLLASVRRLLAGLPVVDERAFGDAGTIAVRESDLPTQLFCLLCEGWQALAVGQVVNGRFRAQQVLKLVEESQVFLRSWALLLERTATILNSSRVTIREEAELLDLSVEVDGPAEAWLTALHLSAARFDSDLSVWFSLHKELLLDASFRPLARLAMAMLGERADSLRRIIPLSELSGYQLGDEAATRSEPLFQALSAVSAVEVGQVNINLFGGLRVDRNGHLLTKSLWHRKKTGILAARLTLCLGTFVKRRTLVDEMWPDSGYPRARQNLYTATSTLKAAFRQQEDGPQYVLTQGDGLALNSEYISSDVVRFDMLAREILLKRTGTSSRQIIEECLKMEELYKGPLFVPEEGEISFFQRRQQAFAARFIDCMVRGIDAAIEEGDLPSASWLTDAVLRQESTREDVLRRAMKVFGLCGRRREVVELYGAHLHYLKKQLKREPEPETRELYESIVGSVGSAVFL